MPTSRGFIGLSIEFRTTEDGPGFMVTDAGERQTWKKFPEAVLLSRTEVVGTPLATTAFEILDAIWLQDDRLRELRGSAA